MSHINGIVDFSFYLIISVGIYYLYTADDEFVVNVYDSMKTLLDFCTHNISENGFFVGDKAKYGELKDKINNLYWNEEFGAYVTSFINGHQINEVRCHANILAIIFDIADENKKMKILNNVLLNNEIPAITTPFFSFFENAALCRMECVKMVRDKIEQYWGAMLNEGATTFWEEYDPKQTGIEKYSMYGRKFEKSLCHIWGAAPICLIGKYIVGIRPTKAGYKEFIIKPNLSGLTSFAATIPINNGKVEVGINKNTLKVFTNSSGGKLIYNDIEYVIQPGKQFILTLNNQ